MATLEHASENASAVREELLDNGLRVIIQPIHTAPLATVWCWYLDTHPTGRGWPTRAWYTRKTTPSFLDALAALRRVLRTQRITAMSRSGADTTKITDSILDTLAYAA